MRKSIKKLSVNSLEQIQLYGDDLTVAVAEDGKEYATLQRMCEAIGVNPDGQRLKLNGYHWARTAIISVRDTSGRNQKAYALNIDDVPAWLMTIKLNKVNFAVREKLAVYQSEAAAVLAAWFLGKTKPLAELALANPEIEDRVHRMTETIQSLTEQLVSAELERDHYRGCCDALMTPSIQGKSVYMTIQAFLTKYRVKSIMGHKITGKHLINIKNQMFRLSDDYGIEVRREAGDSPRRPYMFHFAILQAWMRTSENAIRMSSKDYTKAIQGRLFA